MIGKVYDAETHKVHVEPGLVCNVLAYADSWLSTEFYKNMECEVEERPQPFLDLVLDEGGSMLAKMYDNFVDISKTMIHDACDVVTAFWQDFTFLDPAFAYFEQICAAISEHWSSLVSNLEQISATISEYWSSLVTNVNEYLAKLILHDKPENFTTVEGAEVLTHVE